jgi:hypothetical protein
LEFWGLKENYGKGGDKGGDNCKVFYLSRKEGEMKKRFIASMILVLGIVLLIGTSNAAIVSFKGLPDEIPPGPGPVTFEVWLDGLEQPLSNIADFGLWIGASPVVTWDFTYVKNTTLANPDYVFYNNSSFFDAIPKDGGIFISDVYNTAPASTNTPVKLASLSFTHTYPFCTWITISLLDSGWSYVEDDEFVKDVFQPISKEIHVTPIPGTVLLLGPALIGLFGLARRKFKR